ncbi:MAG: hypothetical protein WDZ68_00605, partial [Candidatus Paceibacterota bacterium]
MNNETEKNSNDRVMKSFAVVGLVIVVILIAWFAIQVIQLVPNAFSSLASLADSVYNQQDDVSLEIASSESTVNSQSSAELRWSDLGSEGTYVFSYECTPGVSVQIRTQRGTDQVECDSSYTFEERVFETELVFISESERFTDVRYHITFIPEDGDENEQQVARTMTIVNPTLARDNGVEEDEEDTVTPPEDTIDTETPPAEAEPTVRYRYVETLVYAIPTSDPNGYTELAVTFLSLGTLTNDNVFIPRQTLEAGERGAIQFEVKNIGTKTSKDWDFKAILPSNVRYNSKSQDALKPNERSVI